MEAHLLVPCISFNCISSPITIIALPQTKTFNCRCSYADIITIMVYIYNVYKVHEHCF